MFTFFKKFLNKPVRRYLERDASYLVRGTSWLALGQGVSALAALILAVAFANLAEKETYGTYQFVLAMASLLAIPTLAGVNTALIRSMARGASGALIPAFKTKVRWGMIGGLAGILLSGYYALVGEQTLAFAFLITAAFIPFLDSLKIYDSYLQGRKRFKASAQRQVIAQLTATAALVLALFTAESVLVIVAVYFLSWTIVHAAFFLSTVRRLKAPKNDLNGENTIAYGKHLSVMGLITAVAHALDKILIFIFLGPIELAVYAFAITPPEQLKGFIKSGGAVLLPKLSEKNISSAHRGTFPHVLFFAVAILVITVLYIIIAPALYTIAFPAYTDSIVYSQLWSISLLAGASTVPIANLKSKMEKNSLYRFYSMSSLLQILLLAGLIPAYGILGAVFARIITRFSSAVMAFWLNNKIERVK